MLKSFIIGVALCPAMAANGQRCTPNLAIPPYDTTTCQWKVHDPVTPVIIDTKNTGFKFSDPTKGNYVTFDFRGDGKYERSSWPVAGSGNAWLVYDRDGDGIIKNGTELFGNYTPHSDGGVPNHPNPNGFLALAWFDWPEQGGDSNLILDKRDKVWQKLRLWIDEHCFEAPDSPCQSQPKELHTLESAGITSISLVYGGKIFWDAAGNEYKFFTVVNPEAETTPVDKNGNSCCDLHQKSKDPRLAYDVWLKTVD